ncbi:ArsR family transcriptional regulator [Halorubrum sp. CBA1125]|uniref:ArsR family transcriptional regulator n=1 Tax=Halorubrum sp. CBA1125 TaxID=2668072 RepID=UPI0012E8C195|nr:ArsR family transcriptional regulator [Halorubrum sp. CBA1125]MUW14279.1 ArsR family transcriptional regulator [Halorubrum sp. CBA1125]
MDDGTRERLDSLPPSAKLVYYVLEQEGRFDQTGLAEETRLSTRTVRFAVEKLTEVGLVEEGLCLRDARRSVYRIVPPSERPTPVDPDAAAESEGTADSDTSVADPDAPAAAVAED